MTEQNFIVQNYSSGDLPKLADFFKNYLQEYPDAKLNRPEFYTFHPVMQNGDNAFCVLDSNQHLVGFAPLFPPTINADNVEAQPLDFWTIILASPNVEMGEKVRELLFKRIVERVNSLKTAYSLSRVRMAADMMMSQKADIEYLVQKGFVPFEKVYVMGRDTSRAIPVISVPGQIAFRESRLASEEEQTAYLQVFNTCFPENPKTIPELQLLLESPFWEKGRALTAWTSPDELVGSILVYWDEQHAQGVTDDVMVLPEWRGRNIAKRLIGRGLDYFSREGIPYARLEVKASNTAAVAVYASMGYHVINEECLMGKAI